MPNTLNEVSKVFQEVKKISIQRFIEDSWISLNDLQNYLDLEKAERLGKITTNNQTLQQNTSDIAQSKEQQEWEIKNLKALLDTQEETPEKSLSFEEFKWKVKEALFSGSQENSISLLTELISLQRLKLSDGRYFTENYNGNVNDKWYLFDKNWKITNDRSSMIDTSSFLHWSNDKNLAKRIIESIFFFDPQYRKIIANIIIK